LKLQINFNNIFCVLWEGIVNGFPIHVNAACVAVVHVACMGKNINYETIKPCKLVAPSCSPQAIQLFVECYASLNSASTKAKEISERLKYRRLIIYPRIQGWGGELRVFTFGDICERIVQMIQL
jgi:hypothetical protein